MLNSELCSDILQHYHMERKDNTDDVRGGILMYFHKSLDIFNCDELNDFSRNVKECHFMWVKKEDGPKILAGCVYRKGNSRNK